MLYYTYVILSISLKHTIELTVIFCNTENVKCHLYSFAKIIDVLNNKMFM
jgi:hypothetical protein